MKVKLPSYRVTKLLLNDSCPISSHYWLMLVQTLNLLGGQPWMYPNAQDPTERRTSGAQVREGSEVTGPLSPKKDSQVKYGEGGLPSQGAGRQEIWPDTKLLPPVHLPKSRPTRETAPAGYQGEQPYHGLPIMVPPSRRERETNRDHDWGEATADRPPEVPDTYRVGPRTPTKGRRDPTLGAGRETPEAYGGMAGGPRAGDEKKGHSCGSPERPREEYYRGRRPSPECPEEVPEAEWQTIQDHAEQEASGSQAHEGPKATANGLPKVAGPCRIAQRTSTQRQGSTPLEAHRELPRGRSSQIRSIQEAPRDEYSSKGAT